MSGRRTSLAGVRRAKRSDAVELRGALEIIHRLLRCPRDRLGRLDFAAASEDTLLAREQLRLLAIAFDAGAGQDVLEQAANVAAAVLARTIGRG